MGLLSFVLVVSLAFSACLSSPSIWPQPQSASISSQWTPLCSNFRIVQQSPAPVINRAITRYTSYMFSQVDMTQFPQNNCISQLSIGPFNVPSIIQPNTDESYFLTSTTLNATSFVGVLRGLETFSSLVQCGSPSDFSFNTSTSSGTQCALPSSVSIKDAPRFPHRGIMLDTARHFLPTQAILRVLDAMPFAKLNVLHLHLVDAESFPLVVPQYPQLAQKGSFTPIAQYNASTLQSIVQYAYDRGVRVVPETDIPGHAYAFGKGLPWSVAQCPPSLAQNINNVPLDPSNENVFAVLNAVFDALQSGFSDAYVHLGGDEVVTQCWLQDPAIASWMHMQGYDANDVLNYVAKRTEVMLQNRSRHSMHWQEAFFWGAVTSQSTIFQVWKDQATLRQIAQSNRYAIMSFGWYFDVPTSSWQTFYQNEPMPDWDSSYVLGGEACAWGEQVDQYNLDNTLWPRALATAERLWSPKSVSDVNAAAPRLVEKICQINKRGVACGPIIPGTVPC